MFLSLPKNQNLNIEDCQLYRRHKLIFLTLLSYFHFHLLEISKVPLQRITHLPPAADLLLSSDLHLCVHQDVHQWVQTHLLFIIRYTIFTTFPMYSSTMLPHSVLVIFHLVQSYFVGWVKSFTVYPKLTLAFLSRYQCP